MRIIAIIQARMGSSRLPSKIMMNLCDVPVLRHVINRVQRVTRLSEVVVATTTEMRDDAVVDFCNKEGINVFRGSEEDVLSRYYHAARAYQADVVIRITSDCPLIDVDVINHMLNLYENETSQFVTNAGPDLQKRTFPRGLDVEIFDFQLLESAFHQAKASHEREHVTPYLYAHCDSVNYYMNPIDYSNHRWTLDTAEDFDLINRIYDALYSPQNYFGMQDILAVLKENPEWCQINAHIEQKKL